MPARDCIHRARCEQSSLLLSLCLSAVSGLRKELRCHSSSHLIVVGDVFSEEFEQIAFVADDVKSE